MTVAPELSGWFLGGGAGLPPPVNPAAGVPLPLDLAQLREDLIREHCQMLEQAKAKVPSGVEATAMVLEGHKAPVVALAVSPDGAMLASASWDHTARLWPLGSGAPRLIEGHTQNVNGVAFTVDGRALVTVGYDATLRVTPIVGDGGGTAIATTLPTPLNTVAVAPDGEIVTAGADGKVYILSATGELKSEIEVAQAPIIAVALSPDGSLIAAAGIRGSVAIIERAARKLERTLVGPGLPVWSAAFFRDGRTLLTGGAGRQCGHGRP